MKSAVILGEDAYFPLRRVWRVRYQPARSCALPTIELIGTTILKSRN
jgi:hypothetical protein